MTPPTAALELETRHVMDDDEAGELSAIFDPEEPEVVLEWAFEHFGADRLVFLTSFQRDGMALLDMASKLVPEFRIATIDTGMLPPQSAEFVRTVERRYGQPVEVYRPNPEIVERMVDRHGAEDFFYRSVDLRLLCCHVRKVLPLHDVLRTADAWVTGLRRDQWATRGNIRKVEVDHDHGGVVKLNPLADWPELYVLTYAATHGVPEHPLYADGYTTIGCAPCTRAVPEGDDPRSGRWWWEENAPKECGIHCSIETGGFEQEVGALLGHDAGRTL